MLDLTKPIRRVVDKEPVYFVGRNRVGHLVVEGECGGYLTLYGSDVENIPELKVATALVAVYKKDTGDIYISTGYEGSHIPRARITYTEGAENPWQIEAVKR